jgi:hypothetical protein
MMSCVHAGVRAPCNSMPQLMLPARHRYLIMPSCSALCHLCSDVPHAWRAGVYQLKVNEPRLSSGEAAWERLLWAGIVVEEGTQVRVHSLLLLQAMVAAATQSGPLTSPPRLVILPHITVSSRLAAHALLRKCVSAAGCPSP